MKSKNHSFYIYDISSVIENGVFYLENKIFCKNLINNNFRRKNIINFELVNSFSESSVSYIKSSELLAEGNFLLDSENKKLAEFEDIIISADKIQLRKNKKYYYQIYSFIDTPIDMLNMSIEERKKSFYKESEIFNLYVIISEMQLEYTDIIHNKNYKLYNGYGQYGFLLTDIELLDKFIENHNRKIDNNIIKEFTTTELAGELFDAGLITLCWGMTPWPYYISTEKKKFVKGEITEYKGIYKFERDIKRVSVINGNKLSDWEECKKIDWPILDLYGDGNGLSISLYIEHELSSLERIQSGFESPIPTLHIERINLSDEEKTIPLLELYVCD